MYDISIVLQLKYACYTFRLRHILVLEKRLMGDAVFHDITQHRYRY